MGGELQRIRLGQVATISSGKRPPIASKEQTDICHIPLIGGGGPSGFTSKALYHAPVLITGRVGTLGKLISTTGPCWPSDNTLVIRVGDARTDPLFLKYTLQDVIAETVGMNRGAANPLITQGDLARLEIAHPPIPEQRAIASVLGALDDKIEQNRRTVQALEKLARAIFRAWFVDFEPVKAKAAGATSFPSMLQPVFDALPTTFIDSSIGLVPEGWDVSTIGELMEIRDGKPIRKTDRAGGPYPVFGANGIIGYSKNALVKEPCAILGKIGSCGALHRIDVNSWVSNNAFYVTPGNSQSLEFVWEVLNSIDFSGYIGGSANPYMPKKNFQHIAVICPRGLFLAAYERIARQLRDVVVCAETESSTLATLRDYLLPKLLSGEVRVHAAEAAVAQAA